ncbi:MAG: response regulator transcription factor [Bacteroidales bacterium]
MKKTINILIVDDSQIHIMGMKSILKNCNEIGCIYEANNYSQALNILQNKCDINVAILDISLEEEKDGLTLAHYIAANYLTINTMILSHYKEVKYIIEALKANTKAYLAKDSSPNIIIDTIQKVNNGKGIFFGDTISYKKLIETFGNSENIKAKKPYELTSKELELLSLLANGYSSKEIATTMQITINTVETYKERIKSKLGVESIMEAVIFGIRHNFIK